MERRSAARVAKWRNRRDTSDAHQQLRALRKLELMEEIKDRVVHAHFNHHLFQPRNPSIRPYLIQRRENNPFEGSQKETCNS